MATTQLTKRQAALASAAYWEALGSSGRPHPEAWPMIAALAESLGYTTGDILEHAAARRDTDRAHDRHYKAGGKLGPRSEPTGPAWEHCRSERQQAHADHAAALKCLPPELRVFAVGLPDLDPAGT